MRVRTLIRAESTLRRTAARQSSLPRARVPTASSIRSGALMNTSKLPSSQNKLIDSISGRSAMLPRTCAISRRRCTEKVAENCSHSSGAGLDGPERVIVSAQSITCLIAHRTAPKPSALRCWRFERRILLYLFAVFSAYFHSECAHGATSERGDCLPDFVTVFPGIGVRRWAGNQRSPVT